MKRSLVTSLLVALAISGCQKVEPDFTAFDNKKPAAVFSATMEALEDDSPEQTKTSMDNEGNVRWKKGDQVSIFVGSSINEHYQVTDESDGKTAANLNRVEAPEFVGGVEIDNNVAFYPYSSTAAISKKSGSYAISGVTLPAVQSYALESFGNGAFPMVAVTKSETDYNLKFNNVIGGLKLQLKGTASIVSVRVSGNNGEILCGDAVVTVANGNLPTISFSDEAATSVTLNCGEGVQLSTATATSFVIALPPMTMLSGFTVKVTDAEGASMEIMSSKVQTITRSSLLKMPAVNYVGTMPAHEYDYVDLGLPSGIRWTTCNIGATAPEEYGDYFAWADTDPYYSEGHSQDSPCSNWDGNKTGYNWASYTWCQGSQTTLTRYNHLSANGTVDNKTEFGDYDYANDVARQRLGSNYRTPTYAEWQELIDNCTWTWTTQNGVNGRLVTGPSGNSIFLPAAGTRTSVNLSDLGTWGNYWASSLHIDNPGYAMRMSFSSSASGSVSRGWRYYGRSIRAVCDEGTVAVASVSLNKADLSMTVGDTETLTAIVSPYDASNKAVAWASGDTGVATVDANGTVTAVAEGSTIIVATSKSGGKTAVCTLTVNHAADGSNGHAYVDLGLPSGVKWATCNVGADAPEEYGDYFAWGESETYYSSQNPLSWKSGRTGYNWASYTWCNGSETTLTRYNHMSANGTIDNKTEFGNFNYANDAARQIFGGKWRTPTDAEWAELISNCTLTKTAQNGVDGYLVTGSNGNSIFLPANGTRTGANYSGAGTQGNYWSSSLHIPDSRFAMRAGWDSGSLSRSRGYRYYGRAIRAVCDAGITSVTGVSLNKASLTLNAGDNETLTATVTPSTATSKTVTWASGNTGIATVNANGKITAVAAGTTIIVATAQTGGKTAVCTVTVISSGDDGSNGHAYVDLGLPSGLKWSTCNLGATAPEGYGDYYAWGEIEPYYTAGHSQDSPCTNWRSGKTGYNTDSYKWGSGGDSLNQLTRYNTLSLYGNVDNKTTFGDYGYVDDAARQNFGGLWRTPTYAEWRELITKCTWKWTTQNGVSGTTFTGPNGNSIFLPAAGSRSFSNYYNDNWGYGLYWTASLNTEYPYDAFMITFTDSDISEDEHMDRYYGYPVRPVFK
ncbi:MAG: Ig-like domain-containing protein [Bacteroidales bacterium]|nr:Ig-like domain-containing protein [Bacteroidales bacterium]